MSRKSQSHDSLISDFGRLFLFCENYHLETFQTLTIEAVILNNT